MRCRDSVVVTGMGVLSPIGEGCDAFWLSLKQGAHGIGPVARFPTAAYDVDLAATIPEARFAELADDAAIDPCAAMGLVAAREAWDAANLSGVDPRRVAIVLGTSAAGIASRSRYEFTSPDAARERHEWLERSGFHVQTATIAEALGIEGPRLTVSTACASSTHALGHARELLASGAADVVLAGGIDALVQETFAGFAAMGAMSASPCAPFSEPVGMTLGEGAGFLAIEGAEHAARRGVGALARISGFGSSADAWHSTAPDPTGRGLARAIRAALADAGLEADSIGYVNAHGTGTDANDAAEWLAIARAFGDSSRTLPVSSTKSYFGHALGAAGALEIIATILALRAQMVLPTLHYTGSRGGGPADPVAGDVARPHRYTRALSINAAFGGANAAVVVGSVDAVESAADRPDGAVVFLGVGALAGHGTEGLDAVIHGQRRVRSRRVPAVDLERVARGVDPRELDTISRQLVVQTGLALADADVRIDGELSSRAGLSLGASRLSWDGADEFWGRIRTRGFHRASVPAFARIVMNAPAGAVSRAFELRGPLSVLTCGPSSTLVAVDHAAHVLASDAASIMVAGSSFELSSGMLADIAYTGGVEAGEGGACFVLARASWAATQARSPIARLLGSAVAGPRALTVAVRRALEQASNPAVDAVYLSSDDSPDSHAAEMAGLTENGLERLPAYNPCRTLGYSESNDALALAAALLDLRGQRIRTALVIAADPRAGSSALVIGSSVSA